MNTVFVDTFYWIALLNRMDPWHATVVELSKSHAACLLVTPHRSATPTTQRPRPDGEGWNEGVGAAEGEGRRIGGAPVRAAPSAYQTITSMPPSGPCPQEAND
jgi:hypothetical protein